MTSPINPTYPLQEVPSLDRLMDIAVGVEHEAADRYDALAKAMDDRGEAELAATFRELAGLERSHEAGLGAWAKREGLPEPKPAVFPWHFPETFAFEEADGSPLSPYQALGIAVRNEERAFSFYTYVAALADARPEVRQRAEALAREELNHIAQLRRLRRRAYHAQTRRNIGTRPVATVAELYRVAGGLERGSAELVAATAECLQRAGQAEGAMLLRHSAADTLRRAESLAELGAVARGGAPESSRTAQAARSSGLLAEEALTVKGAIGLCERDAQEVLDSYLTIAERAGDEALLNEAQRLAEGVMGRLALIRSQRAKGVS